MFLTFYSSSFCLSYSLLSNNFIPFNLQDATYGKLTAARQENKAKFDAYFENRRFGVKVRELCKAGKIDEARAMCEEQVSTQWGCRRMKVCLPIVAQTGMSSVLFGFPPTFQSLKCYLKDIHFSHHLFMCPSLDLLFPYLASTPP
jgi:hypothetical protein